jgi:predicted Zn-dependent peptidase
MKRTVSLAAALLFAVAAHGVAGTAGTIEYTEHTLANGLRVVLSEDHSVPVVAVNVWYHVGSANEEPGRSGFAHLFEHMMFEGSENLDKGDHFKHISRAGGTMNGSTTTDRTNYYEVLENFENQRETVKEERRQRVDNEPYGEAFMVADTLGYDGWPYSHTVIGSMDDLNAAEVGDVQAFFDRYYCPSNAVLVVVGDIDPKKTMKMVEEYFGDIPAGSPSSFPEWDEPAFKGERRQVVDSPKANVPAAFVTYQTPPHDHADTPALELLADLLTDGESSRLHKRLVKEEEAAFGVWGFVEGRLGPSRVMLIVAANAGREIGECETLVYEELERVKQEGLTADELEKLKTNFKTEFVGSRQTVMRKAEELQHYVRFHPDVAEVNSDLERFMAVTAADIQRVANEYLRDDNRTVVVAMPPSS